MERKYVSAQSFAATIRSGHDVPVDVSSQFEMKLPEFAKDERIKKSVEFVEGDLDSS